ncbi:hypothetical protein SAMN04487943_11765 [Gracilibacillus orientalis]|uniref:Uncharacterized protein n=1 Tax=Gracilibacillus orientalis TaxID=334253 RepID=A0A1I4QQJ7_9BACI|nr:hypothetical protein [Gracilibacillus orientalis]SFM41963.1 hypothetical protein SAMN04487943_11765 [Gracilibacillus orientalis]
MLEGKIFWIFMLVYISLAVLIFWLVPIDIAIVPIAILPLVVFIPYNVLILRNRKKGNTKNNQ